MMVPQRKRSCSFVYPQTSFSHMPSAHIATKSTGGCIAGVCMILALAAFIAAVSFRPGWAGLGVFFFLAAMIVWKTHTTCSECGSSVKPTSGFCRDCGVILPKYRSHSMSKATIFALLALGIAVFLGWNWLFAGY